MLLSGLALGGLAGTCSCTGLERSLIHQFRFGSGRRLTTQPLSDACSRRQRHGAACRPAGGSSRSSRCRRTLQCTAEAAADADVAAPAPQTLRMMVGGREVGEPAPACSAEACIRSAVHAKMSCLYNWRLWKRAGDPGDGRNWAAGQWRHHGEGRRHGGQHFVFDEAGLRTFMASACLHQSIMPACAALDCATSTAGSWDAVNQRACRMRRSSILANEAGWPVLSMLCQHTPKACVFVLSVPQMLYTTACCSQPPKGPSPGFIPLTVQYSERFSAAGRTRWGFIQIAAAPFDALQHSRL